MSNPSPSMSCASARPRCTTSSSRPAMRPTRSARSPWTAPGWPGARRPRAPRAGMAAAVPALDKPVLLSMSDMGMHHEGMDHSQMSPLHHAPAESGPIVDMQAMMAMPRLDDPGVGLRDNGRRVLTYADLAT